MMLKFLYGPCDGHKVVDDNIRLPPLVVRILMHTSEGEQKQKYAQYLLYEFVPGGWEQPGDVTYTYHHSGVV